MVVSHFATFMIPTIATRLKVFEVNIKYLGKEFVYHDS